MTATDVPGGDAGRDLYGLESGEFTPARNALAKRLRAAGDKAEAALVAKLRRPPLTAWALNRVARERPGAIDAVLDAGAGLRAATEEALGGDASALRTAQAWERRAVDAATSAAADYLTAAGQGAGDAAKQRMAGTLRAAMVDATVAAALREGVLDDDRDAPGFGLDAFSPAAAGSAARRRAPAGTGHGRRVTARAVGGDAAGEVATRVPVDDTDGAGGGPTGADAGATAAAEAARVAMANAEASLAAAVAAERAERQAAQLVADADEAERLAVAASDAAASARAEAERAAVAAEELAVAAEATAARAVAARTSAQRAVDEAIEASRRAAALSEGH